MRPRPPSRLRRRPAAASGAKAASHPRPWPSRRPPAGARIVVDPRRNLVLFRGSNRQWAQIRSILEKLDRSVPSVLIEVLVAEVSLTDEEKSGFELLLKGGIGSGGITAGTPGGIGRAGGAAFSPPSTAPARPEPP